MESPFPRLYAHREFLPLNMFITVALVDANQFNSRFGVTVSPNDYGDFAGQLNLLLQDPQALQPMLERPQGKPCLVKYDSNNLHRGSIYKTKEGNEPCWVYLTDFASTFEAEPSSIFEVPMSSEYDFIWDTASFVNVCELRDVKTSRNDLVAAQIRDLASYNYMLLIFTIYVHHIDTRRGIHYVDLYLFSESYYYNMASYIKENLLLLKNGDGGIGQTLNEAFEAINLDLKHFGDNHPDNFLLGAEKRKLWNEEAVREHIDPIKGTLNFLSDDCVDLIQVSISRFFGPFDFWAVPKISSTSRNHQEIYEQLRVTNDVASTNFIQPEKIVCYLDKSSGTQKWRRGEILSIEKEEKIVAADYTIIKMTDFDDKREIKLRLSPIEIRSSLKPIEDENLKQHREGIHCIIPNHVDASNADKKLLKLLKDFILTFQENIYILPFEQLETGEFLVNLYGRSEIETGLFELKKYHFNSFPVYARSKLTIHYEPTHPHLKLEHFANIFRNVNTTFLKKNYNSLDCPSTNLYRRPLNPNLDNFRAIVTNVIDLDEYLILSFRSIKHNYLMDKVQKELQKFAKNEDGILKPYLKPVSAYEPCVVHDRWDGNWYRCETLRIYHDPVDMVNLVATRLIDHDITKNYPIESIYDNVVLKGIACLASRGEISKRRNKFRSLIRAKQLIGMEVKLIWVNFPQASPIELSFDEDDEETQDNLKMLKLI